MSGIHGQLVQLYVEVVKGQDQGLVLMVLLVMDPHTSLRTVTSKTVPRVSIMYCMC